MEPSPSLTTWLRFCIAPQHPEYYHGEELVDEKTSLYVGYFSICVNKHWPAKVYYPSTDDGPQKSRYHRAVRRAFTIFAPHVILRIHHSNLPCGN